MYLCHKCSGVLVHQKDENIQGLMGCRCMSGYYRGFEENLTREQAIATQIKRAESWIALYQRQGREEHYMEHEREIITKLQSLK